MPPAIKALARPLGVLVLTFLLAAVVAAPFAVLSAKTEQQFGPHNAVYTLDGSSRIVVSLGPLGTITLPAERFLPLGLGLRAEVEEIPSEVGVGNPNSMDSLGEDVTAYATFFSAPQNQIDAVRDALVGNIVLRVVVGAAILTAAWYLGRGIVGTSRRRELRGLLRANPYTAAAAACALVLTAGVGYVVFPREPAPDGPGSPVFEGTPLAGAQITGRLSGVVDSASRLVTNFIDDNDAFYAEAGRNLDTALAAAGPDPAPAESTAAQTEPPTPSAQPPGATAPSGRATVPAERAVTTVLLTSDVHCNVGMTRVIGDVARAKGIDALVDAGDVSMTGTEAENTCVSELADSVPGGVRKVFVKGNHDSEVTSDAARAEGFDVLEGKPVDIGGVTFLGDGDPRRTVFGSGSESEGDETTGQFADRMSRVSCEQDPDVLLVHDPRSARPALESGCVPVALAGHWHRRVGPEPYGRGVRYVNSTTGGALADALTPGPLRMTAEMTVIRFDSATGAPLDYQVVAVDKDAKVTLSDWEAFPAAPSAS